jgi:hypothetical protein
VGILNQAKQDVPIEMKASKGRNEKTSKILFSDKLMMVSYVPKRNKAVILLSTMHHTSEVSSDDKHKPEIILYYNATKGGVDAVDQMARPTDVV